MNDADRMQGERTQIHEPAKSDSACLEKHRNAAVGGCANACELAKYILVRPAAIVKTWASLRVTTLPPHTASYRFFFRKFVNFYLPLPQALLRNFKFLTKSTFDFCISKLHSIVEGQSQSSVMHSSSIDPDRQSASSSQQDMDLPELVRRAHFEKTAQKRARTSTDAHAK